MVTVIMLRGQAHGMAGNLFRFCRGAVLVDAKTGRPCLVNLPFRHVGQALIYAFLKRQPYIMRP